MEGFNEFAIADSVLVWIDSEGDLQIDFNLTEAWTVETAKAFMNGDTPFGSHKTAGDLFYGSHEVVKVAGIADVMFQWLKNKTEAELLQVSQEKAEVAAARLELDELNDAQAIAETEALDLCS